MSNLSKIAWDSQSNYLIVFFTRSHTIPHLLRVKFGRYAYFSPVLFVSPARSDWVMPGLRDDTWIKCKSPPL